MPRSLCHLVFWIVLLLPGLAGAQAFNVDFGFSGGTGEPSSAFGAAAGQGGEWQRVGTTPTFLDDVAGNATTAEISTTASSGFFFLGATEDVPKLLDDCINVASGPWTVTLSGLEPGAYRLYLYAFSNPGLSVPTGAMTAEGTYAGDLLGVGNEVLIGGFNYEAVDVVVGDDGLLEIGSGGEAGDSGLAGLQLVPLSRIGLNVDFGTALGVPATDFGAAAGQPGSWNDVGLGPSALDDLAGTASDLTILVDGSSTGSTVMTATTDEEALLDDYLFAGSGQGWQVDISGLAPGRYDVYLYASANTSAPTGLMMVESTEVPSLPGRADSQLVEGESWAVASVELFPASGSLTITGSGPVFTSLAGLQVVPSVRQSLNVDLGDAYGIPSPGYRAAGAAGSWNEVGSGVSALGDAAGNPSGVSVRVDADAAVSGPAAGDQDGRLLNDAIVGLSSPLSITFKGLAPGPYRVFVYAANFSGTPTSDLTIQGVAVPSLPGDPGSTLIEGTSWASADVVVADDELLSLVNAGGPVTAIAGVQIVPLTPVGVNVDFGEDSATPSDRVGPGFGAASGQAGRWNEARLGSVVLLDPARAVSGVGLVVGGAEATGGVASPPPFTNDAETLLEDHVEGSGGGLPWSARFTGLPPGDYRVYLYATTAVSLATGNATIDGVLLPSLPGLEEAELVEGISWISVDVTVDDYDLLLTGPDAASGLAGVQIVPRSSTVVNVDFGTNLGAPSDAFGGAAGVPGVWNPVRVGATSLLDLAGQPSGLSAFVGANGTADNGETPLTDEDRLLDDWIFRGSGSLWSVTITGLAAGDYGVYVYGPPFPPGSTGTVAVGGIPIPAPPGDPASMLIEGLSWTAVAATVADDSLVIAGVGDPEGGIAGLQLVPVPEPHGVVQLAAGCATLWALARRRRVGIFSGVRGSPRRVGAGP